MLSVWFCINKNLRVFFLYSWFQQDLWHQCLKSRAMTEPPPCCAGGCRMSMSQAEMCENLQKAGELIFKNLFKKSFIVRVFFTTMIKLVAVFLIFFFFLQTYSFTTARRWSWCYSAGLSWRETSAWRMGATTSARSQISTTASNMTFSIMPLLTWRTRGNFSDCPVLWLI